MIHVAIVEDDPTWLSLMTVNAGLKLSTNAGK